MRLRKAGNYLLVVFVVISHLAVAQFWQAAQWTDDGNAIYQNREGAIVKTDIKTQVETTVISTSITHWQVDANKIRDYFMLNTTDSNYSQVIPVEYPKVGEAPSPVKIGVVSERGRYQMDGHTRRPAAALPSTDGMERCWHFNCAAAKPQTAGK